MEHIITVKNQEFDLAKVTTIQYIHSRLPKEVFELKLTTITEAGGNQTKFHAESPDGIQELVKATAQIEEYFRDNPQ